MQLDVKIPLKQGNRNDHKKRKQGHNIKGGVVQHTHIYFHHKQTDPRRRVHITHVIQLPIWEKDVAYQMFQPPANNRGNPCRYTHTSLVLNDYTLGNQISKVCVA